MSVAANETEVRLARPDDVSVLVEFNRALAWESEGKRLIASVLRGGVERLVGDRSLGFYAVAEREDVVVGALMITTEWSDWRNGVFWWIQSVYVRPEARRQGVFRALFRFVHDLAEDDRTVCGFRLYVDDDNTAAQKTYRALGMAATSYRVFEELREGVVFLEQPVR